MIFDDHIARWALVPDGAPLTTHSSHLLPVRHAGAPAMLKVAVEAEEKWGGTLMSWWDGDGAARVLARHGDALLLERVTGPRSLAQMVHDGQDDEASRIICAVAARLHAPRGAPPPELISLDRWFEPLAPGAATHGGILRDADAVARALLATPREIGVLHGDLHHGNVLDGGARGWLAIDPKRLRGERGFDYVNIFCNPDIASAATRFERLTRQADVVAAASGLERRRLLQWILAFSGLSAAWILADGDAPEFDLAVAQLAAAALAT